MRADGFGFFWDDTPPPPAPKKEKEKRQAPEPTWLDKSYLPGLTEAKLFPVVIAGREELLDAHVDRTPFLFDIESYPNYFIISFRSFKTGNVVYFEYTEEVELDTAGLVWVMQNILIVGFNSIKYDIIIAFMAAAGCTPMQMFEATSQLIVENQWASVIYKRFAVKTFKVDHIDLIEVAPLTASLKIYGGRVHTPRMQDLPFQPGTWLTKDQMICLRWYNIASDLTSTAYLYKTLLPHLQLRAEMSNRYKIDLRSKSDAQMAEAIIKSEYFKRTGIRARAPKVEPGKQFQYRIPDYIQFQTPQLQDMLGRIRDTWFEVDERGKVGLPDHISTNYIEIDGTSYKMGIGGLHSREKAVAYHTDDFYELVDKDVTSYYPFLIINEGVYPNHLGPIFLDIFKEIVEERVKAKELKIVVTANGLKIVVNGTFGKLSDPHSIMYSPENMIQVTLTGQLSLLMLIEWLHLAGIRVVSANTDGIVILCPRNQRALFDKIVAAWEKRTGLNTEETKYRDLYSRDVNNYIAVMPDGKTKNKGAFSNPWYSCKDEAEKLHKNPVTTICIEAAVNAMVHNIPIEKTIRECVDFTKFVTVRTAKGGAVKLWDDAPAEFLGKSIRWYYSSDAAGPMVVAKNGNLIPDSESAKPCNDLPKVFPTDINYDIYIERTQKILSSLAFFPNVA